MAPEVLQGSIVFKAEAYMSTDVYAMGLVMWELISRCNETTGNKVTTVHRHEFIVLKFLGSLQVFF